MVTTHSPPKFGVTAHNRASNLSVQGGKCECTSVHDHFLTQKNTPGAYFRVSPEGVKPMDGLNKWRHSYKYGRYGYE